MCTPSAKSRRRNRLLTDGWDGPLGQHSGHSRVEEGTRLDLGAPGSSSARKTESWAWCRGRSRELGSVCRPDTTHVYIWQKQLHKQWRCPVQDSAFSATCSYQRRQPAVTSHHAWPTIISRLPKKGGLSQWQGRGVAQLGRREGPGSIRPQETTQRPERQPQGAAHPVANTLPFPGDLTPGYETTDRACLAPPTLPCLHCPGFTIKSFCH